MSAEEAIKEKDAGNAAYKKKDFEIAHKHYDKAIELDPHNISFLTNKAAAYYEENKCTECIAVCERAVELGREHRADYKIIAKALGRIGSAYAKLEKPDQALVYYNKSLSEFRDPAILSKKNDIQKIVKEMERKAYINPELAVEEKNKGNACFKSGDFPTAIKHYTEALKRDPDNAVLYSNRAACYTKLMEFQMAVSDCEKCNEKDPSNIKGYIRKGAALTAMRELGRAAKAYEEAMRLDPSNEEAKQGYIMASRQSNANPEERRKQAMNDPEIQAILSDPGMRLILEQMSQDPKSAQEHLKNTDVRDKIMKLVDSGIVQMR